MSVEILNRYTGTVLFVSASAQTISQAVVEAYEAGANLGGANLVGANLGGAYLVGANLGGANLDGANLGGANLGGANLGGAYLVGAYLVGANLGGANLVGAYLVGANLGGANLVGANLGGAYLVGANLVGANLGGAKGFPLGAVLQIAGSRHWITITSRSKVSVGCRTHSIEWWFKNAERVGRQEGYTEEQIGEYVAHLTHAEYWIGVREKVIAAGPEASA